MGVAHGVGNGSNAHGWLDGLQELADGVEIRVRHELEPHQRALLECLGATYVVDDQAEPCAVICGRSECAPTEKARTTRAWRSAREEVDVNAATLEADRREEVQIRKALQLPGIDSMSARPLTDDQRKRGLELLAETRTEPATASNGNGESEPKTCKIGGCSEPAKATHGRYAGLCETHTEEAKAGGGSAQGTTRPRTAPADGKSLTSWIRALQGPARRLERARTKVALLAEQTQLKAELDEAIRRVQEKPTAENLERLAAATTAIRKGQPQREKAIIELAAAKREFAAALEELAAEVA